MDFFEQSIRTYSGKSSEVKPTVATGVTVPNGSRWREVDTGEIYYYNLFDDRWYKFNETVDTNDSNHFYTLSLLSGILKELKKVNLHLSFLTDNTIKDTEVE